VAVFLYTRYMISSLFRFHGHGSLRYVYKNGKAVRSQLLTIKTTQNSRRKQSRVSVVVSKKVLKSAVGRNRIRRRLYEYMRHTLPNIPQAHDIVLIVTSSEVRTMPYMELSAHLGQLLEKAELHKAPKN